MSSTYNSKHNCLKSRKSVNKYTGEAISRGLLYEIKRDFLSLTPMKDSRPKCQLYFHTPYSVIYYHIYLLFLSKAYWHLTNHWLTPDQPMTDTRPTTDWHPTNHRLTPDQPPTDTRPTTDWHPTNHRLTPDQPPTDTWPTTDWCLTNHWLMSDQPPTDTWPTNDWHPTNHRLTPDQPPTDVWPTTDRHLTNHWPTPDQPPTDTWPTTDWHLTNHWPTPDQPPTDTWPTTDWHLTNHRLTPDQPLTDTFDSHCPTKHTLLCKTASETHLNINDPLSSKSFLSFLNSIIRLCINLWKYLFNWRGSTLDSSGDDGELDEIMLDGGLFLGGPAGDAEISAKTSRSSRTTYEKYNSHTH